MNSILLVDDEAAICVEFARTLEGLGFKVEVAPTLESGLSLAETIRVAGDSSETRRLPVPRLSMSAFEI
jgi:ActR/RegA family two-component response regulator